MTQRPGMSGLISIWVRWGDYVLGVRDLRPGESLRAGTPAQSLVRLSADGKRVAVLEEAEERAPAEGEQRCFSRDGLEYTVMWVDTAKSETEPRARRRFGILSDLTLAAALAALAMLRPESLTFPFLEDGVTAISSSQTLRPEALVEPATLELALDSVLQNAPLVPSGDMRCGDADMGNPFAPPSIPRRYEMQGPKDNPDPHLAHPTPGVGRGNSSTPVAMHGLAVPLEADPGVQAPTAAFGRDEHLGVDERDARGNMWGEELGDAAGDNGLGLHHVPSGAQKAVAVAPAADTHGLRVVHTGLRVAGVRKPSEVGRALATHFSDFTRCADGSETTPASAVVSFTIDETGAVHSQRQASEGLDACLSREVESVRFERLPGPAGKTSVSYPLFFLRAGQGLSAPRKQAPEACDCGG